MKLVVEVSNEKLPLTPRSDLHGARVVRYIRSLCGDRKAVQEDERGEVVKCEVDW